MLLAKQIFIAQDIKYKFQVIFQDKEEAVKFVVDTMEDGKETFELLSGMMFNNNEFMILGSVDKEI